MRRKGGKKMQAVWTRNQNKQNQKGRNEVSPSVRLQTRIDISQKVVYDVTKMSKQLSRNLLQSILDMTENNSIKKR